MQEYKDANSCRHKDYPYYDTWAEWYGNDRATGDGAIGFDSVDGQLQNDFVYKPNMEGIIGGSQSDEDVTSNNSASARSPPH